MKIHDWKVFQKTFLILDFFLSLSEVWTIFRRSTPRRTLAMAKNLQKQTNMLKKDLNLLKSAQNNEKL